MVVSVYGKFPASWSTERNKLSRHEGSGWTINKPDPLRAKSYIIRNIQGTQLSSPFPPSQNPGSWKVPNIISRNFNTKSCKKVHDINRFKKTITLLDFIYRLRTTLKTALQDSTAQELLFESLWSIISPLRHTALNESAARYLPFEWSHLRILLKDSKVRNTPYRRKLYWAPNECSTL